MVELKTAGARSAHRLVRTVRRLSYLDTIQCLHAEESCVADARRGNLLWLKGRAYGQGNLSAAVDDLITAARAGRLGAPLAARSVVGTIDIAADDPRLERADREMRDVFAASLSRPLAARG